MAAIPDGSGAGPRPPPRSGARAGPWPPARARIQGWRPIPPGALGSDWRSWSPGCASRLAVRPVRHHLTPRRPPRRPEVTWRPLAWRVSNQCARQSMGSSTTRRCLRGATRSLGQRSTTSRRVCGRLGQRACEPTRSRSSGPSKPTTRRRWCVRSCTSRTRPAPTRGHLRPPESTRASPGGHRARTEHAPRRTILSRRSGIVRCTAPPSLGETRDYAGAGRPVGRVRRTIHSAPATEMVRPAPNATMLPTWICEPRTASVAGDC